MADTSSTYSDRISGVETSTAIKHQVKAATMGDITLSGEQTIDGYAAVTDDRVLVWNQTTDTENGIYDVSATSWTRSKDFNGVRDAAQGSLVWVTNGTTYGGFFLQLTTIDDPIVFDTSSITFETADVFNAEAAAAAAAASAAAASTSETNAAASEAAADADATATAADAVSTAADAASTAADVISTAADAVSTDADATASAASAAAASTSETNAETSETNAGVSETNAAASAASAAASAAGIKWKNSTKAATTGNITLSGAQTIDVIPLVAGDRCLVKNQTLPEENGIYVVVDPGAWTRATDLDDWAEIPSAAVSVEEGTANGDTSWICTSDQGGTLGTTAIVWATFGGGINGLVDDTSPQLGGFLDANGNYIQMETGADTASANPLVIGTDGDSFDITGTTGHASHTVAADRHYFTQYDGILTITHGASQALPGGANITTAAGDIAEWVSTAANTVRCVNYTKADGTAVVSAASGFTLGTPQATTSGTSFDFTSIPSGTKVIKIMLAGVSTNGTSDLMVQLGDAGGIEASGYAGATRFDGGGETWSTGILVSGAGISAAGVYEAVIEIFLEDSSTNTWSSSHNAARSTDTTCWWGAGTKSLTAELDRIRITTQNGTDAFDLGSANIMYI